MIHSDYTNELKFVLSDVVNWLKFAETKHVGLITFNAATLAILFDQLSKNIFKDCKTLLYIVIVFSILSIVISIISFIPQSMSICLFKPLKNRALKNCISSNSKLLFYKDISNYDSDTYLKAFIKKYEINSVNLSAINLNEFDLDICDQIVNISKLCTYKYYLFKLGIDILLIPFIFLILALIIA
ncbi:hypothetical protein [Paraclostridium bifermentans]|uniref:hypothetical protein n=1 Tax=Paraclostridium bifermentans TaxID=1490 RepID=UPI001C807F7F|nr:hypothetical protein [Paraclostridium bifermentans]GIM31526.1 hypothetical protein PAGU1678_07960 [Paraclostridium bifermentans subsp. muricolitidis]